MARGFFSEHFDTPIGNLVLVTDDQNRLRIAHFQAQDSQIRHELRRQHPGTTATLTPRPQPSSARSALEAYFQGNLSAIDAIVVYAPGTPFQQQVWSALRQIPAGKTISYSALATRIGRPSAVRAVGLANRANPIAVVVPCHRVIGANATLTGYAGGLERKQWLLNHEGALPQVRRSEILAKQV